MTKKEINLEAVSLDVLQAALKIIIDERGRTEVLGEAHVYAKFVCLLCNAVEEKEFYAKEVLQINSIGDITWVQLVDENDKLVYSGTYSYTTHRTNCSRCLPRLCRLPRAEVANKAIELARATLWAYRRAGRAHLDGGEEVIRE